MAGASQRAKLDMEKRLAFTRKQTVQAKLSSGESPDAYRRGLAGLRAYRKLAGSNPNRCKPSRMDKLASTESGDCPITELQRDDSRELPEPGCVHPSPIAGRSTRRSIATR